MDNNQVIVSGWIERELTFSHKKYGEGFYETEVASERKSGIQDSIKVLISDRVIDIQKALVGIEKGITGRTLGNGLSAHFQKRLSVCTGRDPSAAGGAFGYRTLRTAEHHLLFQRWSIHDVASGNRR